MRRTLALLAFLALLIVADATTNPEAWATSRSAHEPPSTARGLTEAPQRAAPYAVEKSGGSSVIPGGASSPAPLSGSGSETPEGATTPMLASISGTATWYCGAGSPCTRGYGPSDLVAAIDPTTGIERGSRVTVRHDGRSVTVRIVDVCACKGARVIDLTTGAFKALSPDQSDAGRAAFLSRGVIEVTIRVGAGPRVTLPPTDTAP